MVSVQFKGGDMTQKNHNKTEPRFNTSRLHHKCDCTSNMHNQFDLIIFWKIDELSNFFVQT